MKTESWIAVGLENQEVVVKNGPTGTELVRETLSLIVGSLLLAHFTNVLFCRRLGRVKKV